MSRRFQFSLRALLAAMTLVAIGFIFLGAVRHSSGKQALCLYELAAAAFGAGVGTAIGSHTGKPVRAASVAAFIAIVYGFAALGPLSFGIETVARYLP